MAGLLDGIRVLDFGRYIAGPWCAALLGDFGAEVIRVERRDGGEDRYLVPLAGEFHDLTRISSQTITSPWFPAQGVNETCLGLPGAEMSRMLMPSQLPWKAYLPQKAMSV